MNLIIKLQLQGFHYWPDAPGRFAFLKNSHRHIFYITFYIPVENNNREYEFIDLKSQISAKIYDQYSYGPTKNDTTKNYPYLYHVDFGSRSCEQIADILYHLIKNKLNIVCSKIVVLEDNENGAEIDFNERKT